MTYLEKHDRLILECLRELGDAEPNPSIVPKGFKILVTQPSSDIWEAKARIKDGESVSVSMIFPAD